MFATFDFAEFYDSAQRDRFCRELASALREYGFVKLINHGVPPSEVNQAFTEASQFYHLPLEEKLKSPHPPTAHPHRGFSPVGLENVSAVSNYGRAAGHKPLLKDMKESYDIGSEHDARYANIWPPPGVADSFQPTFSSFFQSCYRAELKILEAISIGVGLPAQTLSDLHADQTNELRLTHYPEVARADFTHSTRIAAHTDFGTITLLFQDGVGGLQMEVPPGSECFVDVPCGERSSECIVNVGDCLSKWTGLHSARHRVHLPGRMTAESVPARFSIAYFAKPDRNVLLRPLLPGSANQDEQYMTADEFQHMRIAGTY
ncbi:hypothetical protein BJY04DRAFT_204547 [Aspergillus karnatakaensis]|uniref:uncharacterized protein n=1 Tax=Aspergillus karnatakaensis TaxID=1810916 RepID=UPI003CCCF0BC